MKNTKHVALRVSRSNSRSGSSKQIVASHNEVFRRFGTCAFGKYGAPISVSTKSLIEHQIEHGIETFLYLFLKKNGNPYLFRSNIRAVVSHIGREPSEQLKFPDYYTERPTSAFVLQSEFSKTTADQLVVNSSGRSLLDAASITRTPLMIVRAAKNDEEESDSA